LCQRVAATHGTIVAMSTTPQSKTGVGAKAETVLEAQAPAFSAREAEAIARRDFDIQASAHPLDSERDQNFRLRAKNGSEWVLKIANPAENPALLDMQTQALLHIAQVGVSSSGYSASCRANCSMMPRYTRRYCAMSGPRPRAWPAPCADSFIRQPGTNCSGISPRRPRYARELTKSKNQGAAASSRRFSITSRRRCFHS